MHIREEKNVIEFFHHLICIFSLLLKRCGYIPFDILFCKRFSCSFFFLALIKKKFNEHFIKMLLFCITFLPGKSMHAVWLASLTKNISQQILLNILFGVRDRISVHIVHKESEWKREKATMHAMHKHINWILCMQTNLDIMQEARKTKIRTKTCFVFHLGRN